MSESENDPLFLRRLTMVYPNKNEQEEDFFCDGHWLTHSTHSRLRLFSTRPAAEEDSKDFKGVASQRQWRKNRGI
jgi:hypothetical protein